MYRVMLVVKPRNFNPCYGMESIRSFHSEAEAHEEAEFLQEHLNVPFFVSVNDQLENAGIYPYLTIATQK